MSSDLNNLDPATSPDAGAEDAPEFNDSVDGGFVSEEAKRRKEEERQAVVKAVQGLQLQSIMHSTARQACMINNTLYREGQQIDGFTIEKITTSSVIVKNGTYRFELKMQH